MVFVLQIEAEGAGLACVYPVSESEWSWGYLGDAEKDLTLEQLANSIKEMQMDDKLWATWDWTFEVETTPHPHRENCLMVEPFVRAFAGTSKPVALQGTLNVLGLKWVGGAGPAARAINVAHILATLLNRVGKKENE
jgi:hypothetical protein